MITNEKMEEYWMRYKSEGVSKGLSMQSYCSLNNIPYNAFEKYLKLRRHFSTAHPVNIVGIPEDGNANKIAIAKEEAEDEDRESNVMERAALVDNPGRQLPRVRIMVDIRMTNGVNIRQKNLDYPGLVSLVNKIETLC